MTDDQRGTQMKFPFEEPAQRKRTQPVKIWLCDICGAKVLDFHCKLRCTNCGFTRDCSDP